MMRCCTLLGLLAWSLVGQAGQLIAQETEDNRKMLVCSTTQVADFARQVVGDRMQVLCVLAPGQDPHLYEIKPSDSRLVARADLCLENGWHLEGNDWMKNLAHDAGKPIVTCVKGARAYFLKEGDAEVHDPHAWFSPLNAAVYVRNILDGVVRIDPQNKDEYQARAQLYLAELAVLHSWIRRQVNRVPPQQRQLVTSHDAFNYFCNEYKFTASAPAGWSTGDEVGGGVTPERRRQAVESIRTFGVKAIFVETSVNPELIQQIAKDAGVRIGGTLYSDSMGPPGTAGETYLGMMRENVLKIVNGLK
ncbi:MAG: metal ABC transporter substrate-binding protein [Planctomycetota bacterium]|nr:metal ABC transporter substrate-binding protein [Planctomycetota bacterium]MEE2989165.1 metal ABC transporter substrate-binding protein [Planctomycetota bacterium]